MGNYAVGWIGGVRAGGSKVARGGLVSQTETLDLTSMRAVDWNWNPSEGVVGEYEVAGCFSR